MKKILFFLFACFLLTVGCSEKTSFTLKGNLNGLSSDTVLVVYQLPRYGLDTIRVRQGGTFDYTFSPDTFTLFSLVLGPGNFLPVYADKGETVVLEGSVDRPLLKGKGDNDRQNRIWQLLNDSLPHDSLLYKVDSLIGSDPRSFTNIYLIDKYYVRDTLPDYEKIERLIGGLSGIVKDTPYMLELQARIEELAKVKNNRTVPVPLLRDRDGKLVSWARERNRYILLDFWASWDAASLVAQDSLAVAVRELKKERFLAISISLDMDREAWLKASDRDTTQWRQVCDFKGWNNTIVTAQGIHRLPANLLLGPDKRIIARDIRGKELVEKVKALIQQDKEREEAAKRAARARKQKQKNRK